LNEVTEQLETLKIEVCTASELSPELAGSIQRRNDREFGSDPLVYDDPEWYILGHLSGKLATHVGVLQRTITVGRASLLIAGVCYLVTEPEYRGRGFASVVMSEAVAFVKNKLGLAFGLLTCKTRLESLYAKTGWRTVVGPTVFAQADSVRNCGGLTMVNECGETSWPEGKIDLCGLPW
jgi:GNAT superfamily N-acetyltransferase